MPPFVLTPLAAAAVLVAAAFAVTGALAAAVVLCRPRRGPPDQAPSVAPVQLVTWVPPAVRLRPRQAVPCEVAPAEVAPAEASPVEAVLAEPSPVEVVPAEPSPVETVPVMPVAELPGEVPGRV